MLADVDGLAAGAKAGGSDDEVEVVDDTAAGAKKKGGGQQYTDEPSTVMGWKHDALGQLRQHLVGFRTGASPNELGNARSLLQKDRKVVCVYDGERLGAKRTSVVRHLEACVPKRGGTVHASVHVFWGATIHGAPAVALAADAGLLRMLTNATLSAHGASFDMTASLLREGAPVARALPLLPRGVGSADTVRADTLAGIEHIREHLLAPIVREAPPRHEDERSTRGRHHCAAQALARAAACGAGSRAGGDGRGCRHALK